MLKELIGNLPIESGLKRRMRFHQAWWRGFVLNEEPGKYPGRKDTTLGSTITNGEISSKNFVSTNIRRSVDETIQERIDFGSGIIEKERLFNNLLSSQLLCFNFFGELKVDTIFALAVLQCFFFENHPSPACYL